MINLCPLVLTSSTIMALRFSFLAAPQYRRLATVTIGFILGGGLSGGPYDPPSNYYNNAEDLTGNGLKSALHNIIDNHVVISYSNVKTAFRELDKDPNNSNNVILIYSGTSVSNNSSSWNREHLWPRSYGADSGPAYSDAHHLFPANAATNSDRSNYAFDELQFFTPLVNAPESKKNTGSRLVEPRDEDKGRIARAILYMETRYDSSNSTGNFILSDIPNSGNNRMGKLSTLIKWNREFPPDEYERRRNHLIYEGVRVGNVVAFQGNRNPYVDHPELVDAVHTADDYMSWGTWHIQQFSFYELGKNYISSPLADPDQDNLENFMEFALQRNPLVADVDGLPSVEREEGFNFFIFSWLKEPEHSYLTYDVEFSSNPLDPDSWQSIQFSARDLLTADRGQYEDASLLHVPPESDRDAYYRITAERSVPGADPMSQTFDPALHDVGSLNLFTYTEGMGNGWRWSDYMGPVQPGYAPWFYQENHSWLYSESAADSSVWFHDPQIGWFFTRFGLYPFLYSAELEEWLYFLEETQAPNRSFFNPSSGLTNTESEIFNK
jgi:endonuclease I